MFGFVSLKPKIKLNRIEKINQTEKTEPNRNQPIRKVKTKTQKTI
jgi:hypothetical protein